MTTYLVLNDKKFEITERGIGFEIEESISIDTNGETKTYKVFHVRKLLRLTGDKMDVDVEVHVQ